MNDLICCQGMRVGHKGLRRVYLCDDVPMESVQAALDAPGDLLKTSPKATVRRVDGWVLKSSRGVLRQTLRPARHRRAWVAAHRLMQHGVEVPRPVAFVERRLLGLVFERTMVAQYLEGYRDVEVFLQALARHGAGQDTVALFLRGLADAVNRLTDAGACHADLSGKNIYTREGTRFVFIDLDAVELGRTYTREMRMKNHVQLYDSFCDTLSDTMLVPFIQRMIPEGEDPRVWLPAVRKGQRERRKRLEARRERQARR